MPLNNRDPTAILKNLNTTISVIVPKAIVFTEVTFFNVLCKYKATHTQKNICTHNYTQKIQ